MIPRTRYLRHYIYLSLVTSVTRCVFKRFVGWVSDGRWVYFGRASEGSGGYGKDGFMGGGVIWTGEGGREGEAMFGDELCTWRIFLDEVVGSGGGGKVDDG